MAAHLQAARWLTLELTEITVGEKVAIREFTRCLRKHGVCIIIGDLGAAYSNLDFVLDVHPDAVGIDCRYTRKARHSAKSARALRHLLTLCRGLTSCVVLEDLEENNAFARLPTGNVYLQSNVITPLMRAEPPLFARRPKSRAWIEAPASRRG